MKLAASACLLAFAFLGFAKQRQTVHVPPNQVMLWAEREVKDGPLIRLRGHVQVRTGSITIEADEADYNPVTGSLDPRGHLHISLKNVTPHLKIQDNNPEDVPTTRPPR